MSRWGGTAGGTYSTSNDTVATSGIGTTDFDVRTNTIPGGWDGSDAVSSSRTVYHTYQFTNVTSDIGPVTLSGSSSQISLPDMTSQSFDPSDHERRAFGERYGLSTYDDDAWPYIISWSWEIYTQFGGDITNEGHTFHNGNIVTHPTGNGTTFDAAATWKVVCNPSYNGGQFAAGTYVIFRRTIQIMDDNGPEVDITGDYNGSYIPVASGGPKVRIELKSGRDGNAGDGPFFGCGVLIIGDFQLPNTGGLPVPVGTGKPTTIITS